RLDRAGRRRRDVRLSRGVLPQVARTRSEFGGPCQMDGEVRAGAPPRRSPGREAPPRRHQQDRPVLRRPFHPLLEPRDGGRAGLARLVRAVDVVAMPRIQPPASGRPVMHRRAGVSMGAAVTIDPTAMCAAATRFAIARLANAARDVGAAVASIVVSLDRYVRIFTAPGLAAAIGVGTVVPAM